MTRERLQLAGQQLDERRLSRAVGSDDGDPRVQADVDVDPRQYDLRGVVSEADIAELKERRRDLIRFGESGRQSEQR